MPRASLSPSVPQVELPWVLLVRDNERHGLGRGRIILTARYREALAAASVLAKSQWRRSDGACYQGPMAMVVTIYEPDRKRDRDIGNYLKLICDAMKGAAYDDDAQIDDLHVIRGPIDKDRPRATITVTPLGAVP